MPSVIVAGLGPAGADLVPVGVADRVTQLPTYLRTRRHPAADQWPDLPSFDEVYDASDSIDEVYPEIVRRLIEAAHAHGQIQYLVPGSPLVAEHTVELLRVAADVDVEIIPAVSFLDLSWLRLGIDPLAEGIRLVDGHRFEDETRVATGPLLVGQCDSPFVLSDIKLSIDTTDPPTVTVLQRLGLPDEAKFDVAWDDLDREVEPDHLTSLYIPSLPARPANAIDELHAVVARLWAECPWDKDQSHQSLARFALEEAHEVADAIAALDPAAPGVQELDDFVHELGDLLFQVMLHAAIGEESGDFTFVDVAEAITRKMIRRHPHVFDRDPSLPPVTMAELSGQWEAIKAEEKAARKD